MARTAFRGFSALALSLLWGLAYAQDSEPYDPDPPDRAARLSYMEGEVSLQPAGEQEWAAAILNRPLTTGDKLWTEQNSRAEIQVGPASVRLDSDTGFSFLNVDSNTIQMRVTAGVINVSVRALRDNEHIEIDTPNIALTLLRPGIYRVEVNDDGDSTVVKVSEGAAEAIGSRQNVVVHAQQVVTFRGNEDLVAQFGTLGAPDDFDSWTTERDRRATLASTSRTAEYVAPDVTGYEDLEENGTWSSEPEYGYVWTPRYVAAGWAPYRYGRWVSVAPWGWTWIDDARWGYAPFHYGRWAHVRHRWCWVPGPRHVRAVYAPALVGWVGSPGLSVSWFPLGPREVYVPGRRYSRHYMDRVNHSNTVIADRSHIARAYENRGANLNYRNRAVPGGVTAVSRAAFTGAEHVGNHRGRFNESELARGPVSAEPPRIDPVRESRLGGRSRGQVRLPPQSLESRQVVVRREPPAAVARFARRPQENRAVAGAADRPAPPARGQARDSPGRRNVNDAVVRDRQDRPPRTRTDRPVESAPQVQSPVSDPRGIAARVREDRDRQVREAQEQPYREPRQENQERQPREWRTSREPQQTEQRQRPVQREQSDPRARSYERPRVEQPRVEQPRPVQPRVEQPRVEQSRVERPRAEQPRAEQSRRSEGQNPSEQRSQPHRRQENDPRARKD